jgi:DNA polymerase-3 subunit epsilon
MRQIILDTETTGMDHREGHRIIEIGCVEMIERRLTGRNFHVYINPERAVDAGALEVHGITDEFLSDKPKFGAVARDFVDFVRDSEIIIHNAPFDVGFLNAELARMEGELNLELEAIAGVLDTLVLARELHPGQRVSLDALCKRYDVDHSNRDLHGALLDAELLAEVYLAMTGGQVDLALDLSGDRSSSDGPELVTGLDLSRLVTIRASDEERAAHEQRLDAIEAQAGGCLWRKLEA